MAQAFAFTYNKMLMKGFADHTDQPLTAGDNSPYLRLNPNYVRQNVRVHTGELEKIAHGMIHNDEHLRRLQTQGQRLGAHMGDRKFGHHF
jgi:hypothetical protein